MFYFFVFMMFLMALLGIAAVLGDAAISRIMRDFDGDFDGELFEKDEEI